MFMNLKKGNMLGRCFGISVPQQRKDQPDSIGWLVKDRACFLLQAEVELIRESGKSESAKRTPATYTVVVKPKHTLRYTKAPSAKEYRTLLDPHPALVGQRMRILEPFVDGEIDAVTYNGLDKQTADTLVKQLSYFGKLYVIE